MDDAARSKIRALGLVAAGVVAGGVLASAVGASAAGGTPSPRPEQRGYGAGHPDRGPRPAETPLAGDALAKVKAAVEATYPGATVVDAVVGDDGAAYEAHITKKDGSRASVELDKAFTVTGEEQHGPPGPR